MCKIKFAEDNLLAQVAKTSNAEDMNKLRSMITDSELMDNYTKESPVVGNQTPDIELSSPSGGGNGSDHHHSVGDEVHELSDTTTTAKRPSPLRDTAGVAALLDGGSSDAMEIDNISNNPGATTSAAAQQHHQQQQHFPTPKPFFNPTGGRTADRGGPSSYRGVVWHKSNSKWEARIYEGGKQKFLGYFTNEDAAAMAYDDYAVRIHGNAAKLNFPERYEGLELPPPIHPPPAARHHTSSARSAASKARVQARAASAGEHAQTAAAARRSGNRVQPVKGSSRYRGVSWNSNCSKWRAQVWKGSEVHHLGYFEREDDAARAYDEAVLRIRGLDAPTNYPHAHYGVYNLVTARSAEESADNNSRGSMDAYHLHPSQDNVDDSGMLGVSWSSEHSAWVAEIWDGRRYELIGVFPTEMEAAKAYDVACLARHGEDAIINFPITNYEMESAAVALKALSNDPSGLGLLQYTSSSQATSREATPGLSFEVELPVVAQQVQYKAEPRQESFEFQPLLQPQSKVTTSRFIGVSFDRRKAKWFSQIQIRGNRRFLGYFESEEDAARAYDAAALKLHGPSAMLNFTSSAPVTVAPAPAPVVVQEADGATRLAAFLQEVLLQKQQNQLPSVQQPAVVNDPSIALNSVVQALLAAKKQQQEQAAQELLLKQMLAEQLMQAGAVSAVWKAQYALNQQRLAIAQQWALAQQQQQQQMAAVAAAPPTTTITIKRSFDEMVANAAAVLTADKKARTDP